MFRTRLRNGFRRSVPALCAALLALFSSDSGPRRKAEAPPLPDARIAAREAVLSCGTLQPSEEKSACYERALLRRLIGVGVRDALAVLKGAAAADSEVARDGHVYAHGIGIEAYRLVPSVAVAFPNCTSGFASGCYHGVIQAHLDLLERIGREEVSALCEPYRGAGGDRWLLFQCLHGMGHGLTMRYGHQLPRALRSCDLLTDGWERESCYGGAFMENIMRATAPRHPASRLGARDHGGHERETPFRALDPRDPLYPCSIMPTTYLRACYLIQTSAMLQLNGGSIAAAARQCDRAPRAVRPVCYQSLGRDVSAYANQEPARAVELCSLSSPAFRPSCYFGAVKSLVDWTATLEPGFRMCRIVPSRSGKESCYEAVGEQIASLRADIARRAEECLAAESGEFVRTCRYGARIARSP